jgi:hypothetical protein
MVAQVRYSVAGRSGGRVMSCAVCTVHIKMRSKSFLVEPQNQVVWFVSGLDTPLMIDVIECLTFRLTLLLSHVI